MNLGFYLFVSDVNQRNEEGIQELPLSLFASEVA